MSDLTGFEKFCGSPFWDNASIYSDKPDVTPCFENTLLIWGPCFVLWLLAPFWTYMCARYRPFKVKYSWLTYSKTIVIALLAVIEIAHIVLAIVRSSDPEYSVYSVDYVTPIILLFSYCFVVFFIFYELKYGLRSSMFLFAFWGFLLLFSTFKFRSKIIQHTEEYPDIDYWDFILFFEFYGLLIVIFILTLFSERSLPLDKTDSPTSKSNPEPRASLLSRLTFWWLNPLILSGYKKDFTREDMWDLDESEKCVNLTKRLEKEWSKIADKYIKDLEQEEEAYEKSGGSEEEFKSKLKEPSLAFCLTKIFYGKFAAGAFMKLIQDLLSFVGPVVLNLLIEFTNNKDQNVLIGYFLTILLFSCSVLQTIMVQHYFHRMFIVGARIRTALMGLIYKKSLRLTTASRKGATTGEIVNLMQVNTQTFVDLTTYLNMLWSAPLQIIISVAMLWRYLGVASLAGLATMILFIPINIYLSNKSKMLQISKLKYQDSRIKLTNEILNGIKVLKLYGWELSFRTLLEKIREGELGVLLKMGIYNTIISFSWGAASFLLATASFIVYILIDENNNLDASTAFVSLTLFNIIRFPLMIFPQVITSLIQANVSMTRIRKFLLKDEIDELQISHKPMEGTAVQIRDVNLGWSPTHKTLKNINLDVKQGELVAIVGTVGSGKSSMLSGILGEMHKFTGSMNTNGSMAYVAQQAWIQNATLKNNILFGCPLDQEKYERILDACALRTDLNILPAGDSTEIGEKGINLSGGQKQRVSLSRAVYNDAEIYLLDDPLSAVDAHVGKHIFEQVIGPKGLLSSKTRIFATNNLAFLHECDRIIFLEKGSIIEIGTYNELTNNKTKFSEFIGEYLTNNQNKKETEDDEEEKKETKKSEQKRDKPNKKDDDPKEEKDKTGEKLVVKEKVETGKVKLSVLIEYFKSCTLVFSILFLVFYILMSVAQSAVSIYLSDWADNSDNPDDNKYVRLGVYTAIGLAQYTLMLIGDLCFLRMLMRSARFLHGSMLYSILRSTMQFFESTPVGRIINRFSKDIEAVEVTIPASYKMLIRCVLQVILTVVVISISTPYFIIPLFPITIIYILVQRYYVASMRQLRRLNSASKSPIFSHFGETLTGLGTIRAYKAQTRFIKTMEDKIDDNLVFYYPDTVSNRWLGVRLEFIGTLVTLFACLFAVIERSGSLTGGQAGLSISYSLNIAQMLNWLVRMSADFESAVTSVERIKEYCETPHEAPWTGDSPPPADWPEQGAINFNSYSVKYREELDFVLKDIKCSINPSEKIGIVGRTGAGKSSLTLGLFRILESTWGSIVIDGRNIRDMGLHELRKKLTIIPQDPVLFSGTLRVNLDPFELYSDETIWRALENAHLKEFVMSLDKKLEFECTEGGENLSVGQRQLVCLARALLRKTKILILDEATAAVDMNTDELIQTTIRTEFADCTILTIAHRLNTIMDYTKVMVLDQGKIIEYDSPAALLANKSSVFYSMASSAGLTK